MSARKGERNTEMLRLWREDPIKHSINWLSREFSQGNETISPTRVRAILENEQRREVKGEGDA